MGYYRPVKVVGSAAGRPGIPGEAGGVVVITSDTEPTSRADGSELVGGDLWWDPATSTLLCWLPDTEGNYEWVQNDKRTSLERISSSQTTVWVGNTEPANNPNGLPGWYFTNADGNDKILWNLWEQDVDAKVQFTYGDLRSASLAMHNSGNTYPFFSVYTRRKNDGLDAEVGYRSRINFKSVRDDSSLPKSRLLTTSSDTLIYSNFPHSVATMDVGNSVGPMEDDEVVKSISLSTSTGKNAGAFNFTAQELILDTEQETFHIELDFDTSPDPNTCRMYYQDTAPGALTRNNGDLWYDTVNGALNIWTGSWTSL